MSKKCEGTRKGSFRPAFPHAIVLTRDQASHDPCVKRPKGRHECLDILVGHPPRIVVGQDGLSRFPQAGSDLSPRAVSLTTSALAHCASSVRSSSTNVCMSFIALLLIESLTGRRCGRHGMSFQKKPSRDADHDAGATTSGILDLSRCCSAGERRSRHPPAWSLREIG